VKHYNESDLLKGLYSFDPFVLEEIYNSCFPPIKEMILKNKGSSQDAEDLFQDIMIILCRKVQNNSLNLTSSLKTFLLSIGKNLWRTKLMREKRYQQKIFHTETDLQKDFFEEIEKEYLEVVRYGLYQKHFLRLPNICQKLLSLFLDKIPFKQIANQMGFSSEQYAKKRKHSCKQRLLKSIFNDPEFKSYIDENNPFSDRTIF
jgi:RNA polymerase sigma factor (sigma-70 family)